MRLYFSYIRHLKNSQHIGSNLCKNCVLDWSYTPFRTPRVLSESSGFAQPSPQRSTRTKRRLREGCIAANLRRLANPIPTCGSRFSAEAGGFNHHYLNTLVRPYVVQESLKVCPNFAQYDQNEALPIPRKLTPRTPTQIDYARDVAGRSLMPLAPF